MDDFFIPHSLAEDNDRIVVLRSLPADGVILPLLDIDGRFE